MTATVKTKPHKKAETILKCQCSQNHCCGKDTGSGPLACSMRGNIAGRWGATLRCIHSTISFPLENASKTLEGQRILIICGDDIYRILVHGAATPT